MGKQLPLVSEEDDDFPPPYNPYPTIQWVPTAPEESTAKLVPASATVSASAPSDGVHRDLGEKEGEEKTALSRPYLQSMAKTKKAEEEEMPPLEGEEEVAILAPS